MEIGRKRLVLQRAIVTISAISSVASVVAVFQWPEAREFAPLILLGMSLWLLSSYFYLFITAKRYSVNANGEVFRTSLVLAICLAGTLALLNATILKIVAADLMSTVTMVPLLQWIAILVTEVIAATMRRN